MMQPVKVLQIGMTPTQQAGEQSHYRKLIRNDLIDILKDRNAELQVKLVSFCSVVLSFNIMGKVWNAVRQRRYK